MYLSDIVYRAQYHNSTRSVCSSIPDFEIHSIFVIKPTKNNSADLRAYSRWFSSQSGPGLSSSRSSKPGGRKWKARNPVVVWAATSRCP